jgi:hypothetical protein
VRDRLEGWKQAACLFPSFETLASLAPNTKLVRLAWA